MIKKISRVTQIVLCLLVVNSLANAELQPRPGGMVYDSEQNLTWVANASMGGMHTWSSANAWAANLVYEGFDDWRLPSARDSVTGNFCDFGNIEDTGCKCEMGNLFLQLGGFKGASLADLGLDDGDPFYGFLPGVDTFWLAEQRTGYTQAYTFVFQNEPGWVYGVAGNYFPINYYQSHHHAWAVRDGDVNTPPVAYAGADQAISLLNTEVQLDGSGSYDDNGDTITYDWDIFQKPAGSSAVLSSPTSATPTFTPDAYGDYVIELTVSDPTGIGSTDSVTVSFDNVKPVANAGGNKSSLVGETVVLDGTGSTDANGDPLTYSWSLVSKPEGSTATLSSLSNTTTSFVGDTSGTYDINLIVNDGLLDSDPNTASILTITVMNAMTQVLDDTMAAINSIPPVPKLTNALTSKINVVLKMIDKEQYQEALDKLTDDILIKTDGCANGGEPDEDDWIKTCEEQDVVYSFLMEAISIVNSQL